MTPSRPRPDLAVRPQPRRRAAQGLSLLCLAAAATLTLPAAVQAQSRSGAAAAPTPRAAAPHPSQAFWQDTAGAPASFSASGAEAAVQPLRFRALTVDHTALAAALTAAPMERSDAARMNPLVITLPHPRGGFQRFAVVESPVVEAGLAAKHPDIRTYTGRGLDDAGANLRLSVTPLGVQASVRSARGGWYIDPYYQRDTSLYVSYFRGDLPNDRAPFTEPLLQRAEISLQSSRFRAGQAVLVEGLGFVPNGQVTLTVRQAGSEVARQTLHATASADGTLRHSFTADPYGATGSYEVIASDGRTSTRMAYQVVAPGTPLNTAVGADLRIYRLALLTDPAYAEYFGAENVTAAKVALINRVNHVYENDSSVRLVLIANNDVLNLNTAADMTGTNGPCGATACYTTAQANGCGSGTLTRTRQVIGLLAGASNFDVGHIALGRNGGGVASLGVVGANNKAQGCTGIAPPIGDIWAIDYVAHELGHQFGSNHTFNGAVGNCSGGNRSAANSVEPGSGSSVMAYAGICGTDNLQLNTDPYWSFRSLDVITAYLSGNETNINEVQMAALTGFSANGLQFQLSYNGQVSAPIVRGSNYTTAGIKAAIEGIAGWPAGGTVTIASVSDGGFQVTFGGALAGVDAQLLQVESLSKGVSGFIGEVAKGGATTRNGTVVATGNQPPVVTAPAGFTIPVRTPFALTGSAVDPDGDTLTFMWEQTDRGASAGAALINDNKVSGPLFRQFGKRAVFDPWIYDPPGQNEVTTNPTRVFPDWDQILGNNTNAETGGCPNVQATPTEANIECYSEFLPTAAYVGFAGVNASPARLNFRLTARDGLGGVNSASTVLTLAPGAGPFLVTAPNTAVTLVGSRSTQVTWNVANTNVAPVGTTAVDILLSVDGGATWPHTLASKVPNNGASMVTLPDLGSSQARVKVAAVGNVFFDVSNADFTIRRAVDVNGDGTVDCADLYAVRDALGTSKGQPGFNAAADVNFDGLVNVRDVSLVTRALPAGTSCK